jgi:hypothetical protein
MLTGAALLLAAWPANGQAAAAANKAGTATIVVYRKGAMFGAATHWPVFANLDYLGHFRNANFASVEVPEGTAILSADKIHQGFGADTFLPSLQTAGTPCDGVDWRHLGSADPGAVAPCDGELMGAYGAIMTVARAIHPSGAPAFAVPSAALYIDEMKKARTPAERLRNWDLAQKRASSVELQNSLGEALSLVILKMVAGVESRHYLAAHPDLQEKLRICGPPGSSLDRCTTQVRSALKLANPSTAALLRVPVLAGKTYYVRISLSLAQCKAHHDLQTMECIPDLSLVDAAVGSKETSKLHPVNN